MTTLPSLLIGKHIARYPIIQGGMGIRISGANLAGAVANAGGIGIVSAVGLGLNSPSPVGMPGRALKNNFVKKAIAHSPDLEKRCIAVTVHRFANAEIIKKPIVLFKH